MKITDLIVEKQNVDEVSMAQVGQTAGKIIGGTGKAIGSAIGATAGGIKQFGKGFMSGLKGGYSSVGGTTGTSTATTTDTTGGGATASAAPSGSASAGGATASAAPSGSASAGGATASAASTTAAPPASTTAAPAASTTPASTTPASASTTNVDDIIAQIGTLSPTQKATLKTELDKVGIKATPSSSTAALGTNKQKQNAADADERRSQIAATQAANIATAQADNALVAAVKAAKAKPGFQQTAQDKLTIKQGAAKGIRESKKNKKKVVVEFHSKFLDQKI